MDNHRGAVQDFCTRRGHVFTNQPRTINQMWKCICEKETNSRKQGEVRVEKGNICWCWMKDGAEEQIDEWIFTISSLRSHKHTWQVTKHVKVGLIRPPSWGWMPLAPLLSDFVPFPCSICTRWYPPLSQILSAASTLKLHSNVSGWRGWDGTPDHWKAPSGWGGC